jgi:DNA-directed RNA polymerase specialized sigma24 family protein
MKEIVLKKYELLIVKMAYHCFKKLPKNRLSYEMDDLIQEGRLTFLKAIETYESERGCKFITYFFRTLQSCYFNILRKEIRRCVLLVNIDVYTQNKLYEINPERELLISEEINALPIRLASLIKDGVSDNMYKYIKNRMRMNQMRKGKLAIDGIIRLNKKIINSFFKIKV